MHIDFERDRKLLGLPPKAPLLPKPVKVILAGALVVLLAVAAGWLVRALSQLQSESGLNALNKELHRTRDPERLRQLALEIRETAPDTASGRLTTAGALEFAADCLPEQRLWQQEALANYLAARDRGLPAGMPDSQSQNLRQIGLGLQISGLLLNLGQDRQAKEETETLRATYGKSEAWYDFEDNYTNLLAYILSSAADSGVRNGKEALRVMNTIMKSNESNQNIAANAPWSSCCRIWSMARQVTAFERRWLRWRRIMWLYLPRCARHCWKDLCRRRWTTFLASAARRWRCGWSRSGNALCAHSDTPACG